MYCVRLTHIIKRLLSYLLCVILPLVAGCPTGFTQLPEINGCYMVGTNNLNWSDAGSSCMSLHSNAHLVVIDNAAEDSAILTWLSNTAGNTTLILQVIFLYKRR